VGAVSEVQAVRWRLPDAGYRILLWLHEYKQKWNRTFLLQNPVKLPPGARVVAEPTIPIEFLTLQAKP